MAMTAFRFLVQSLALLYPLALSLHVVRADPKLDLCFALGTVSVIAGCLDPFIVGDSPLPLRNAYTTNIQGTSGHMD